MSRTFIEDQEFDKHDFVNNPLQKGEYENCRFLNCDFSTTDLSGQVFVECEFNSCNLSMTPVSDAAFREVRFSDCKMLGFRLDTCNPFMLKVRFENCQLNHSSCYRLKLKRTTFINCQLIEADFVEGDLNLAVFDRCDLTGAVFENSILEGADFRTSHGYTLDPEINHIHGAKFSRDGLEGLLHKYNIEVE